MVSMDRRAHKQRRDGFAKSPCRIPIRRSAVSVRRSSSRGFVAPPIAVISEGHGNGIAHNPRVHRKCSCPSTAATLHNPQHRPADGARALMPPPRNASAIGVIRLEACKERAQPRVWVNGAKRPNLTHLAGVPAMNSLTMNTLWISRRTARFLQARFLQARFLQARFLQARGRCAQP